MSLAPMALINKVMSPTCSPHKYPTPNAPSVVCSAEGTSSELSDEGLSSSGDDEGKGPGGGAKWRGGGLGGKGGKGEGWGGGGNEAGGAVGIHGGPKACARSSAVGGLVSNLHTHASVLASTGKARVSAGGRLWGGGGSPAVAAGAVPHTRGGPLLLPCAALRLAAQGHAAWPPVPGLPWCLCYGVPTATACSTHACTPATRRRRVWCLWVDALTSTICQNDRAPHTPARGAHCAGRR